MWWNDLATLADALPALASHIDSSAQVSPRATVRGTVRIGAGSRICDGPICRARYRSAAIA